MSTVSATTYYGAYNLLCIQFLHILSKICLLFNHEVLILEDLVSLRSVMFPIKSGLSCCLWLLTLCQGHLFLQWKVKLLPLYFCGSVSGFCFLKSTGILQTFRDVTTLKTGVSGFATHETHDRYSWHISNLFSTFTESMRNFSKESLCCCVAV